MRQKMRKIAIFLKIKQLVMANVDTTLTSQNGRTLFNCEKRYFVP